MTDAATHSVVCAGCGLPELHKMCFAYGTPVYMNPDHPAWGKRDEIQKLKQDKPKEGKKEPC